MTLNCKVGDLAYIIYLPTRPELFGRIVTVEAPADMEGGILDGYWYGKPSEPGWIVSSSNLIPWHTESGTHSVLVLRRVLRDSILRPIRYNEGDDQMLTRVGKPSERKKLFPEYLFQNLQKSIQTYHFNGETRRWEKR